jgi:hypothetical protein
MMPDRLVSTVRLKLRGWPSLTRPILDLNVATGFDNHAVQPHYFRHSRVFQLLMQNKEYILFVPYA